MGALAAMTTGTVLSGAVTTAWAWLAPAVTGNWIEPHWTASLAGDYAQALDAASGGHPVALFTVAALIYSLCFLAAELRWRKRVLKARAAEPEGESR